jgi:hypothetical protein
MTARKPVILWEDRVVGLRLVRISPDVRVVERRQRDAMGEDAWILDDTAMQLTTWQDRIVYAGLVEALFRRRRRRRRRRR